MGSSPNIVIGQIWSPDQWNEFLSAKADDLPYTKFVPLTGQIIVTAIGTGTLILVPATELSSLTIVAPGNASDSQIFRIASTQVIDSLTVQPAGGQTLNGGDPFPVSANGAAAWMFVTGDLAWYRIQ